MAVLCTCVYTFSANASDTTDAVAVVLDLEITDCTIVVMVAGFRASPADLLLAARNLPFKLVQLSASASGQFEDLFTHSSDIFVSRDTRNFWKRIFPKLFCFGQNFFVLAKTEIQCFDHNCFSQNNFVLVKSHGTHFVLTKTNLFWTKQS